MKAIEIFTVFSLNLFEIYNNLQKPFGLKQENSKLNVDCLNSRKFI